jgi:hypothetical protein
MKYSKNTEEKIRDYYTTLYLKELGLRDWKKRVKK